MPTEEKLCLCVMCGAKVGMHHDKQFTFLKDHAIDESIITCPMSMQPVEANFHIAMKKAVKESDKK